MKMLSLRALAAVVLAGAAALLAVKARERRRALTAGPFAADPSEDVRAESHAGEVATGEGMPEPLG